jgi:hypothetical protein
LYTRCISERAEWVENLKFPARERKVRMDLKIRTSPLLTEMPLGMASRTKRKEERN